MGNVSIFITENNGIIYKKTILDYSLYEPFKPCIFIIIKNY